MKNLAGSINRAFHRTVDLMLGIDRSAALNLGREAPPGHNAIAAELRAIVQMMKAEAFDPSRGAFDYRKLRNSDCYQQYRACSVRLIQFDPGALRSREERLAFWINLYNALIIDAVICYDLKRSIREDLGFFRRAAYVIGGHRYSADDIEHGILRGNRRHFHPLLFLPQFAADDPRLGYSIDPVDPRVHCALVCASRSCPPINVYAAERIDDQLDLAACTFVNHGGVSIQPESGRLCLSRIFGWYRGDFGGRQGVLDFVLRYLDEEPQCQFLQSHRDRISLRYESYDWSLNQL